MTHKAKCCVCPWKAKTYRRSLLSVAVEQHQLTTGHSRIKIKELAAAVPEEPAETGSVIRFRKYRGAYTFAALKVPAGRWFLTQDGSRTPRQGYAPKDWGQLLTFIGEHNWGSIEVLS